MGITYKAECRDCNSRFYIDIGDSRVAYILHCDLCGETGFVLQNKIPEIENRYNNFLNEMRAKYDWGKIQISAEDKQALRDSEKLYYSEIENYAGQCKCGGYFKKNAKPRCPNCKSTKIKKIAVWTYYD